MPHATATFNGKVIAETNAASDNRKFPSSSIDQSVLTKTNTHTPCPWKGEASYYTLTVDGQEAKDSAWYYPEPKEKAKHIKDHVAFYKSKVEIKIDQ